MTENIFKSPEWLKAMNAGERAQDISRALQTEGAGDSERAGRRLERWRAQSPFQDDSYFTRRLESDGLTEAGLLYLLGETAESLGGRTPARPEWLAELERAFSDAAAVPGGAQGRGSESPGHAPPSGFLAGLAPLVRLGMGRVRAGAAAQARKISEARGSA